MYIKLPLALLFIFLTTLTKAQLPTSITSTLPPSIKWQQINSPHFKVLYTQGNEHQAQKVTNILECIYEPASRSLGAKPRKFPIVIQNERSESNGFVTVGPFRSELYSTAPQNYLRVGNDEWLERLIVHEYRHIVQFQKAVTPFNKTAFFLTGEFGAAFFAGIAAPSWFWEGDAVGIETAMGRTGRGVIPSFLMAYKANLIEKGGFNYYKQHLGSFRDFVPNHYVTGYLMTTHMKNEYGQDVWDKIVGRAFRYPYIPGVFSSSIKKATGNYLIPAYKEMMAYQRQIYEDQLSKIEPTEFELVSTKRKKTFTNYQYPQAVSGKIIALKSGLGDIRQIVSIDNDGMEEKLVELGAYNDIGFLSANDKYIVWTEFEFDPRWRSRNYLTIRKYNLQTGELIRLGKKKRYTSVSLSPDSEKLIVTEQDIYGSSSLKILDAETGEVIIDFENENNYFYSMPSFDSTGENIICLISKEDGKSIIKKSISSGIEEEIFYSDKENIGVPIQSGEFVYFNTNYNGIDNIFRVNMQSKNVEQVSHSRFGAFNANIDNDTLYYSDYTADGFEVVSVDLSEIKYTPRIQVKNLVVPFAQKMIEQEHIHDILYQSDSVKYDSEKYNRLLHSVRPVSWGIVATDFANTVSLGVSSRDILGTSVISAGTTYNYSEDTWRGYANYSYQALYPLINFRSSWGKRSFENDSISRVEWKQSGVSLGLSLPLILTKSRMSSSASIRVSSGINNISGMPERVFPFNTRRNGYLNVLSTSASYSRIKRRSKLDVQSRWGQTIAVHARLTPYGGDYHSTLWAAESNLYLPGVFKHHALSLKGGYQYENKDNYYFSMPITYTRGYNYFPFDHFTNYQINYGLPLAHMDWHIGPFFNLQRVRTNLFYDHGYGRVNQGTVEYFDNRIRKGTVELESFGTELLFSFNMFRYLLQFDAGIRYTYLRNTNTSEISLVLGGISF
ncbi:WD40 repeat domain-containing protein [Reichenbachiella versicolor]|uniref:hypothetical protein n=1 Tax=Reichenbachiella versicolor TaxID=1821036 RepID=UPI0013A56EEB|nr:hypothetical protein [Reichenbachiella versicolor]